MKKLSVIAALLVSVLMLCSCGGNELQAASYKLQGDEGYEELQGDESYGEELQVAEPVITEVPVQECAVIIEKQPTDEHLTEGAQAIFIAKASGSQSVRWIITDPTQAHMYDEAALKAAFPGLEIEGMDSETLKLKYVPAGMDGFKASALFSDEGGEVQTGLATINVSPFFTQIPHYYMFSSGAGAWRTVLKINDDGSFEGQYSDSDNSLLYLCSFTGHFGNVKKVDGYSYTISLLDIEYTPAGQQTYSSYGYPATTAEPYGLDDGEEFTVYLPGIPKEQLPEDFRVWSGLASLNAPDSLEGYGIYNVNSGAGFVDCTAQDYTYARF